MTTHARTRPDTPYTELETPAAATDAAVVADLALGQHPIDIVDVTDDDGEVLEQRIYGRTDSGGSRLVETVDLERHRDRPRATRGEVEVHTPAALVAYAERFLDEDASTLWGDVEAGRLTVIFNDDASGAPGHRDHRSVLGLQTSPEMETFLAHNETDLSQEQLAEFIEENRQYIVSPSSATMLEVAQTFQATTGVVFKRAQTLHSGEVRLTYDEDINASAGSAGETEVPREFVVALRPFLGTDPVEITAQFRYRIRGGKLTLGYRLLNIDDVRRTAVDQVLATVADELGLAAIEGVAPEPRR